jgi:glutathione S-transferase
MGYKIIYFDGRGRAEVMRFIFAVAGVDYTDQRVDFGAGLAAVKPLAPFGQLPLLEVDGKILCQSNACARYLAKHFKLAGKTDFEQAQADMIVDCLEDAWKPILTFTFETKDETKKAEQKKKFLEEQLPQFLTHLENILKKNHGGDKFFVGTELTWADLALIHYLSGVNELAEASAQLASYPKLKGLGQRVEALPKVAAWIAKRPKTQF